VLALREATWAILDFLEAGGDVLLAIGAVTFLMWTLILERYAYLWLRQRREVRAIQERWEARRDRSSWYAQQLRERFLSEANARLRGSLPLIKTLVALCPLLGLLGTVTGMIEVFDVMAIAGSGNARAMASGVSKATIPTMAGMVAALSGLYFSHSIERSVQRERQHLADRLI
jgi:biopolymer transport protein ExbB